MTRAKRHHQVPRFYLRAFADPKGRIQVYDRVSGRTLERQRIENVAVESDLYTVTDDEGRPSDGAERAIARLEGGISESLSRLRGPDAVLAAEDQANVAAFIALQFVRTTAMRDQFENLFDLKIRMMTEANVGGDPPHMVERFIEKRHGAAPDWLKEQVRSVAADPSRPIRLPTEEWLVMMAELLPYLASELLARTWRLLMAGEGTYLTCDNPIALIVDPADSIQAVRLRNAVQILMPVAPDRLLVIEGAEPGPITVTTAYGAWIRWANRSVANRSSRHVYWHPRSNPMKTIQIPSEPRPAAINGIPVQRGERSWDKIRGEQVPGMHRVRGSIRAARQDGFGEDGDRS